jgi:ketosteroid isomerase-like protein
MAERRSLNEEREVQDLDLAWNEVYLRNDRSGFAAILADDFVATMADGTTGTKADMMRPTPEGAKVSFSDATLRVCPPTAIARGRVKIEHAEHTVDQWYVRIYSKRDGRWQAVAAVVFPAPDDA